jgi:hypothetical protein
MAFGVQIFDASSNLVLDTTDTVGFIKAVYTGSIASGATVNLTVPAKSTSDEIFDNTLYSGNEEGGILDVEYTTSTNIRIRSTVDTTVSYRIFVLNRGY